MLNAGPAKPLTALTTQEKNKKCQSVINECELWCESVAGHNPRLPCLFEDALDLIPFGTYDQCWPYSQKLAAIRASPQIARQAHCIKHRQACPVCKPIALFDVSGLPCPDMSTAGLRRKRAGSTADVYIAHGEFCTRNRIPLLLVECTPDTRSSVK